MLEDFDTDCPSCGSKVKYSLSDVARGRTVRCARGHSVTLKDEGGGAAEADKAARDVDKALSQLSRTINFKL
jgi:hypothetical protein